MKQKRSSSSINAGAYIQLIVPRFTQESGPVDDGAEKEGSGVALFSSGFKFPVFSHAPLLLRKNKK